jgi:N-acetylmuramoyl-L-alanine amidase
METSKPRTLRRKLTTNFICIFIMLSVIATTAFAAEHNSGSEVPKTDVEAVTEEALGSEVADGYELIDTVEAINMIDTASGEPEDPAEETQDANYIVNIIIDGEISHDISGAAVLIDDTTYIPIRAFCERMGSYVEWVDGTVWVTSQKLSMNIPIGSKYFTANGRYLHTPPTVNIDGTTMIPIRPIAKTFDATVDWDGQTRSVIITSGSGGILSGSEFYNSDDVYWLSRIINAEARGEIFEGRVAVGNVILNRVASPLFPDTVYSVIFDNRYGIQFTPAYSGAIYNSPSEDCVIAAKIALEGYNFAGNSLYFSSAYVSCWATWNRPFNFQLGNHAFYA